jgi:hypothetical protein
MGARSTVMHNTVTQTRPPLSQLCKHAVLMTVVHHGYMAACDPTQQATLLLFSMQEGGFVGNTPKNLTIPWHACTQTQSDPDTQAHGIHPYMIVVSTLHVAKPPANICQLHVAGCDSGNPQTRGHPNI